MTYSAWIAQTARKEFIIREGLDGVGQYEAEHGPFTPDEIAEADEWAARITPAARRTADRVTGVTYASGALIAAEHSERRMWARHRALLLRRVVPTRPRPCNSPVLARHPPARRSSPGSWPDAKPKLSTTPGPGPSKPWRAALASPTSSTPASSKAPCGAAISSSAPMKAISRPSPRPSAAASTSTIRNTRPRAVTHHQLRIAGVELLASPKRAHSRRYARRGLSRG
jgi:hypothetical protein